MLTTSLACARCLGPFGAGARAIDLLDLTFHEACVPSCRECGSRLQERGADGWNYTGQVVSARYGYQMEPTEFWCQDCWELGARSESFAQD
jgi:hypothetical protein